MLPQILPHGAGFRWADSTGTPTTLTTLVTEPDADAVRWLPTHLQALDELLIEVTGELGEVLGGARGPRPEELDQLAAAYVGIDNACLEYADALAVLDLPDDPRGGQVIGTAALLSIRARFALGLISAVPFAGELDMPAAGPVGGTCDLTWVDTHEPWRGARWIVTTTEGARLPATLAMMLFDSSGVNKDAALDEHRLALRAVTLASGGAPLVAAGAVDWLLFDWVMAHREDEDSAGVRAPADPADAQMIVQAAAASARLRQHGRAP